jgi:ABC-type nitrate/sulfonate/bicarbonate transport system ATPase subunit
MEITTFALPPVTVSYKSFSIHVEPIELSAGEILGIFGKSGAGKTSYMKYLRDHFDSPIAHYMSQFDSLLEEITVRQNIELALSCSGKSYDELKNWEDSFKDLLEEFEINKFLAKYPGQLSGGQRKRVELARCLMMDPKLLLLDEPFVGIGHLFEAVATKYILHRAENKTGNTIIVSHDFDLLCKFSKRVMLVDDQGVIGFAPTVDPSWKPQDVRTAWTLGIENVIPVALAEQITTDENALIQNAFPDAFVSFWAWMATWTSSKDSSSSELIFHIPAENVLETRTYLLHGTVYTRVTARVEESDESIVLVGKGEIGAGETISLVVKDVAIVGDNNKG